MFPDLVPPYPFMAAARAIKTAVQAIAAATQTKVTGYSVSPVGGSSGTMGAFEYDSTNDIWVLNEPGFYRVHASIYWQASGSGFRRIILGVQPTTRTGLFTSYQEDLKAHGISTTLVMGHHVTALIPCIEGNALLKPPLFVQVSVYTSVALNIQGAGVLPAHFSIFKVADP